MVSKFGADIPFQLEPFFLLVTTYKNTILRANDHNPGFLGPVMICMTKEEHTYLSFMHSLLREVPGFSHYLHDYGTDNACQCTNGRFPERPRSVELHKYKEEYFV